MKWSYKLIILLATPLLLMTACASEANQDPGAAPKGPALIMFYTDN